jgi:hypothetical protein
MEIISNFKKTCIHFIRKKSYINNFWFFIYSFFKKPRSLMYYDYLKFPKFINEDLQVAYEIVQNNK